MTYKDDKIPLGVFIGVVAATVLVIFFLIAVLR
jgi:hypothetical protein